MKISDVTSSDVGLRCKKEIKKTHRVIPVRFVQRLLVCQNQRCRTQ